MPRRAGSGGAREEETTSALARRPHCLCEDGLRRGCCASARRRSDGAAASWIHGMNNSNWGMRTPQLLTPLLLSSGRGKLRRNRVCQAVYLVAVLGVTIRLSRTLHGCTTMIPTSSPLSCCYCLHHLWPYPTLLER